ncbi:hydroxysteroid dehydrogenase-like protein 2 [Dendronephthya gigantea]|uniref:hydroxysteroid dehydrogenase-like protein 2 n=1 Tax=Dendronephthya gigantea TaxID=151771 RepID=UPI001069E8E4|nr:hydroxysteroid dehydrogenase-like protein 2 [Dendronephthya gigantea]
MLNTGKLAGKTIFISGASRGIGKAIALKAAKDGANIVIAAKTAQAHPKLPGTIYTAAKEVEEAGGQCLPCVVDIRDESAVKTAVESAVEKFGGIDVLVNNASAISLTGTLVTPMKRYDLMNNVNARGTFLCSQACIPYLKQAKNPHILNISPPLNMNPMWFKGHVAYTMAKYGMSMCVLGMAEEFKDDGIAVNALWPKTAIETAAMEMLGGGETLKHCRKVEIMSDAAYVILTRDSKSRTGEFLIDEDVLREVGVKEFEQYACVPGADLLPDFFLDAEDVTAEDIDRFKQKKIVQQGGNDELHSLFVKIKGFCSEDAVSSTQAMYQFNINDHGVWYLDLKTGSGDAGQGDPASTADVTFSLDKENFVGMFTGKLKPTAAFMQGKLKIKGDMMKAMKLESLMSHMKSKL